MSKRVDNPTPLTAEQRARELALKIMDWPLFFSGAYDRRILSGAYERILAHDRETTARALERAAQYLETAYEDLECADGVTIPGELLALAKAAREGREDA